ncbi:MAG: ribosome small subunit-dependent GTPase A [Pseudomonadota bacterium]
MIIEFSFETLRRLGLTPAMAQTLATTDVATHSIHRDATPPQWMRATAVHRETVEVHDGTQQRSARCTARLTRELIDESSALAVGDWVLVTEDEHRQLWVTARVPPLNQIVRRDADGSRHTVVSNVDTALLVMGLDLDFNLQRLERYLALVGSSGVLPVVVLTKADVVQQTAPDCVQQRVSDVRARIGQHVDVMAVDARSSDALDALRPYLSAGQTLVLLGSSGAGKSTLTNSLLGSTTQDTGAVREHDSRGKHTTTARSLHLLPTGACVIDTPGVRTLRPDVDGHVLGQLFEDISTLAHTCRFRDCQHQDEPGCAVRAQVSPERLKNYHKLLRESRRDTMGALERQSQLARWKVIDRAGRQRLESKRAGPVS